jgi:anti-sigma factor RsiW
MTNEQQLKLQAFLDGELPEREAREILAWTQRDSAAADLLAELKNTRAAMAKSEPHLSLPESREFFWSKIEREIQRSNRSQLPRRKFPFSLCCVVSFCRLVRWL